MCFVDIHHSSYVLFSNDVKYMYKAGFKGLKFPIRPAIHFLYFAFRGYFTNVFAKHTTKYDTLYTFRISWEFIVLLMLWKNKPRNPLSFCANADPAMECCEMRKKWCETPCYILFVFCISQSFSRIHDKSIAGLTASPVWLEYHWFILTKVIINIGEFDRNATCNKWRHWSQLINSSNVIIHVITVMNQIFTITRGVQ